jgi:hypothetical protein
MAQHYRDRMKHGDRMGMTGVFVLDRIKIDHWIGKHRQRGAFNVYFGLLDVLYIGIRIGDAFTLSCTSSILDERAFPFRAVDRRCGESMHVRSCRSM